MQKTAYEMRISDWSSDVCSSDLFWQYAVGMRGVRVERIQRADDLRVDDLVSRPLLLQFAGEYHRRVIRQKRRPRNVPVIGRDHHFRPAMRNVVTARHLRRILHRPQRGEIGSASWRERVWTYV